MERSARDGRYLYALEVLEPSLSAVEASTGEVLRRIEGLPKHTWEILWVP